jgi:translation initiation factor IF-2
MIKLFSRSPVVVVLGHVDHGKTTLLDYIRKSRLTKKEIGGITQSIGAYEVSTDTKGYDTNKITFIDTPGHEAFTKLRLRGANVADIAILVIDGVDSVMPQTVESIYHIKNANIPFIVVINKIDLPQVNIDKVKKDLLKHEVLVEGMGGDVPLVSISAKEGTGVKELLETILFIASVRELKYSPNNPLEAYIIESKKGKLGPVASVIIKDGTLKLADTVYTPTTMAKIKAIVNDGGNHLKEVCPSTPFLLFGFRELPEIGITLTKKRQIQSVVVSKVLAGQSLINPLTLFKEKDEKKKLKIVIKTDSQGSLEAILANLDKNENIETILASVGEITKSDVFLAKISKAIIISFSVAVNKAIIELTKQEKVILKSYSLIYELLRELTEVSSLLREKEEKAQSTKGEAKILATFIIEKEKIAGIKVLKGKINVNDQIELYRDNKLVGRTKAVSLKKRAKTVNEIKKNEEAGMIFYPLLDFNIGDVVKSYSI